MVARPVVLTCFLVLVMAVSGHGEDQLDITGCIGMCFREPLVEVRENEDLDCFAR